MASRPADGEARTVLAAAQSAYKVGLCVLPVAEDGTKRPACASWEQWTRERPSKDQMRVWFRDTTHAGLGLVCGAVSGNVECLEFDDRATYNEFINLSQQVGLAELVQRIEAGYSEETPNGGIHWLYRCEVVSGNTKLARRPKREDERRDEHDKIKVLIETRGSAGFVIVAPSNGKVHPTGRAYRLRSGGFGSITTITRSKREALFDLARGFDRMPRRESRPAKPAGAANGTRPGDEFNRAATWAEVLEPHGWRRVISRGDEDYWCRPGKTFGVSATTNFAGSNLLKCFSTSTPFDTEHTYTKFAAHAVLNHGGDFAAAAADLAARGFGQGVKSAPLPDDPRPRPIEHSTESPASEWPAPPADAAFSGLAGEIVSTIDPHTEADSVALLVQVLISFGAVVGRRPHARAEADRHGINLWAALVGRTAKGRKGTSWGHVRRLFEAVEADWSQHVAHGLSSGEGLMWAVRDPIMKGDELVDAGISDKRLLIIESEFASTLRVLARDGNTLSAILRTAWDSGDLRTMTKHDPARATGAHISIIVHCTKDELLRYLNATEAGNGFANRFLWICCRRSKVLPDGGRIQDVDFAPLVQRLREAVAFAAGVDELKRDPGARALWHQVYPELSEGRPGLLGAVTARAEAQVMRLACVYALLFRSYVVTRSHLEAALAVWDYCAQSAAYIFGASLGDPVPDEILRALRMAPEGMTRTEIRDLFGRNRSGAELGRALGVLAEHGLIARVEADRGEPGRPAEMWRATTTTKTTKTTRSEFGRIGRFGRSAEGKTNGDLDEF